MATFKIFGASKETAEDVVITIDATDFREAEQKANAMGMYVSKVEPINEPATTVNRTTSEQSPGCPACGAKKLHKKKIHRLSGPAVVIGYILLIPSLIGILLNLLFLVIVGMAGSASVVDPNISDAALTGACCGIGIMGVGPVVGMVLCFVSGLLGWILVMKKNVLVCAKCATIVSTVV